MKKKSFIILLISFIALLLLAIVLYSNLSGTVSPPDNISPDISTQQPEIKVPDFTVNDFNNKVVYLSDLSPKPTVINFWATWCGPCKSELPFFENMFKEYGDKINFMMINLTDGQRETTSLVKSFIEKNNYTFPVYFDTEGNASSLFDLSSIPVTVFIDADGNYKGGRRGAMTENILRSYINILLGE